MKINVTRSAGKQIQIIKKQEIKNTEKTTKKMRQQKETRTEKYKKVAIFRLFSSRNDSIF